MAREEIALHRIERNINAIEEEVAQMRYSLKTYASNPRKYEPQLENLAQSAHYVKRSVEIILRAMGLPED